MIVTLGEAAQLLTALAAVGAVMFSVRNGMRIKAYRVEINHRVTELLMSVKTASHAEGVLAGRLEEQGKRKR